MEDHVERTENLHSPNDLDLHFRFTGVAKDREFVVNLQCSSLHQRTGEPLRPEEYDFMAAKVLELVISAVTGRPNPGLN